MEDFERGQRLREEMERLGLNQTDFASYGRASKSSQILYEKGKPPTADYLAGISLIGADITYILTGRRERPASELTDRARLLAAIEAIEVGLGDKRLPPAKKAEAILLAYELLAEPAASRDNVVELIRRVA